MCCSSFSFSLDFVLISSFDVELALRGVDLIGAGRHGESLKLNGPAGTSAEGNGLQHGNGGGTK